MKITEEKKHEYWNHFIAAHFVNGPRLPRITGPRLRKIKPAIWADKDFWFDILFRHCGNDMIPEQMIKFDGELYKHCCGNFWGMIHQTLIEEEIVTG